MDGNFANFESKIYIIHWIQKMLDEMLNVLSDIILMQYHFTDTFPWEEATTYAFVLFILLLYSLDDII